jgi:glycosyltransferase involved in cell wall biosynthesis
VFGIVFLEALACGVSVIGSKVDGSRETLLDSQLGRLVDPNLPAELVKAIAVGATAAIRRNVDDERAQAICRTQNVRAAERTRSFR